MKLYSGPLSLFTAKVRIALAEKNQPYERVTVGWSVEDRYLPHHPDVVALNPKRQVPVLVDGDTVVTDSTQILEYLEDRLPDPPLYPRDVAERARCRRLEAEADESIFPAVWDLIEETFYPAADGERDAARADAARGRLAECHASLDRELAGRETLCNEGMSVADIGSFVMLNAGAGLGAPASSELTNLAGWIQRIGARPAVAREVAEMQQAVKDAFSGG